MILREIREKQNALVVEARGYLDAAERTTDPAAAADLERQHDAAMTEYDRLEGRAQKLERLAAAEADLNAADPRRPSGEGRSERGSGDELNTEELRSRAFRNYLRFGRENLTDEERAHLRAAPADTSPARGERRTAQGEASASIGGYLVPTGFMPELVVSLKATGPMMDSGSVRQLMTADGRTIPWPTMDDTGNEGRRISENTQINPVALTFGTKQLNAWKYTTDVVLVASELLQDSAIDVETIVRDAMAVRLGRIGNLELTTGTGIGSSMPEGIVSGASNNHAAAAAAAITFDDVIETFHSVDPAYRNAPKFWWQFADSTLKSLRKLKDSYDRYIWQPANVAGDVPATILDKKYWINQAMSAIGASNVSVLIGDHDKYVRRMVNEFQIRRLTERYADYDQVGFIGFARMDGQVLDGKAFATLTHPAS